MYITPAQLADGPGALRELAQLFEIDELLLDATLAGDDRGEYTADDIAAADEALASIEAVITRTTGEMDAYFARRGYSLPLDPLAFPVLTTWARYIARYHLQLQRDRTTEDSGRIERDYRNTLQVLERVAQGRIALGAGDTLAGGGDTVLIDTPDRPAFSHDSLQGYH